MGSHRRGGDRRVPAGPEKDPEVPGGEQPGGGGRVRQGTVPWRTNKFHESLTCELSNGMVI